MSRRLLAAGYALAVHDIAPDRTPPGARACEGAAEVARNAEMVLVCLTGTRALEEVILGPGGVAEAGTQDKLLVDLTSGDPQTSRRLAAQLHARCGMRWLDAPISGGVAGAAEGSLAMFCGADAADVERFRPVAAAIAQNVTHMGAIGAGQATKLCNQVLVGGMLALLAETVNLARRAGIDAAMLPAGLAGGFADSRPLQVWGPRMASRRFEPQTGHASGILKDLEAATELARACGAPLPMAERSVEILRRYAESGGAGKDSASLVTLYDS